MPGDRNDIYNKFKSDLDELADMLAKGNSEAAGTRLKILSERLNSLENHQYLTDMESLLLRSALEDKHRAYARITND